MKLRRDLQNHRRCSVENFCGNQTGRSADIRRGRSGDSNGLEPPQKIRWKMRLPTPTASPLKNGAVALHRLGCNATARKLQRGDLQIAALRRLDKVIGRTDGQSRNRHGRMVAATGDEAAPVHDEQVRHVVRAVELVDDRRLRICSSPTRWPTTSE